MNSPGLLLVAHGTRDPRGVEETRTLAERVREELPDRPVELCFLELAEPNIEAGYRRLYTQGVRQITVAPLLLFKAGHAKDDIPGEVRAAGQAAGEAELCFAEPLGCHPKMVKLSRLRFQTALDGADDVDVQQTLLLMVGRGSRDASANAQLARFARLRFEQTPVGWLETCYLAMAEPKLERAVEIVAGLPFRRIVVQPHLLFQGELADRVARVVADCRRRWPDKSWLLTDRLGPHPLVAQALAEGVAGCG